MKKCTIYHNPRCSKSRQTLALLQENGIECEIVEYLKTPLKLEKLMVLAEKLGHKDFIRKKEERYKELNLSEATWNETLKKVEENPILLERPLVETNSKAAIGRPPENVLELF